MCSDFCDNIYLGWLVLWYVFLSFLRNSVSTWSLTVRHYATNQVEVHDHDWWIQRFEAYGFRYSNTLTEEIRDIAKTEARRKILAPTGDKTYRAGHVSSLLSYNEKCMYDLISCFFRSC